MTTSLKFLPMRPREALPFSSFRRDIIPGSTIAIKRDGPEGVVFDLKVLEGDHALPVTEQHCEVVTGHE